MTVAITVRNVPDEVRDELAARAASSGKSLQEYVRALLVATVQRPSVDDVMARAGRRVMTTDSHVSVQQIIAARDADRR